MGFFYSKPIMKNQSTSTNDIVSLTMEEVIIKKDLEKVKQLSKFKYNVIDCIFLAAKEGQLEILKYLSNNVNQSKASFANLSAM